MSVLVKGMEMPNGCFLCILSFMYFNGTETVLRCNVLKKLVSDDGSKDPDCPLTEIPQHGRLIDADKLLASFKESIDECHKWANEVPNDTMFYARVSQALGTFVECALRTKGMPTAIPADEESET